jgi:hypothetical protein
MVRNFRILRITNWSAQDQDNFIGMLVCLASKINQLESLLSQTH